MSHEMADRFVEALWALESDRDLDRMAALYTDDAEIGNAVTDKTFTGPDGAREFWGEYRGLFGDLQSTFKARMVEENRVALEWHSDGTSASDDHALSYDGVSIFEHDGERLTRFRAYFDSRHLDIGPQHTSA